jgi:hypothetical protein
MKHVIGLVTTALLLLAGGCGGDSHQSLADESMATMKEMVATLDNIKDEASAKSNKSRLKAILQKMNGINDRQAKLPAPTEADLKAMEARHGKEMEELQTKMAGHMMRIAFDPKISAELKDLDEEFAKGRS